MTNILTTDDGFLVPVLDEDSVPFWEGTRAGELRVQACAACGRKRFPPRPMCPWCRSLDNRWDVTSGTGTVWSFVIAHPPLLPAYAALSPYNAVVVALDDDPLIRFAGNLVAGEGAPVNSVEPATIEIGQPVRVVFEPLTDEIVLPRWVRTR